MPRIITVLLVRSLAGLLASLTTTKAEGRPDREPVPDRAPGTGRLGTPPPRLTTPTQPPTGAPTTPQQVPGQVPTGTQQVHGQVLKRYMDRYADRWQQVHIPNLEHHLKWSKRETRSETAEEVMASPYFRFVRSSNPSYIAGVMGRTTRPMPVQFGHFQSPVARGWSVSNRSGRSFEASIRW